MENLRAKELGQAFVVISNNMKRLASIYSNLEDGDSAEEELFEAIDLIRRGCLKGKSVITRLKPKTKNFT